MLFAVLVAASLLSFVVRCLLSVDWFGGPCCFLYVAGCLLCVACCLLPVWCCLLCAVCCVLVISVCRGLSCDVGCVVCLCLLCVVFDMFDGCCFSLCVACCMLFVGGAAFRWCMLLLCVVGVCCLLRFVSWLLFVVCRLWIVVCSLML